MLFAIWYDSLYRKCVAEGSSQPNSVTTWAVPRLHFFFYINKNNPLTPSQPQLLEWLGADYGHIRHNTHIPFTYYPAACIEPISYCTHLTPA